MDSLATAPGVVSLAGQHYFGVEDVMKCLGCKQNKAYGLIRQLRGELIKDGKLTPAYPQGKVPKKYFMERCMIEE